MMCCVRQEHENPVTMPFSMEDKQAKILQQMKQRGANSLNIQVPK